MSNLSPVQQSHTFQVLTLIMAEGLSQKEACERTGISDDTFRRYLRQDPDYAAEVMRLVQEGERELLLATQAVWAEGTLEVLRRMRLEGLETNTLLALHEYVTRILDRLERRTAVKGETKALDFLRQGPQLKPAQSRFAGSLDISPSDRGVHIDVYQPDRIIDVEAQDLLPDQDLE